MSTLNSIIVILHVHTCTYMYIVVKGFQSRMETVCRKKVILYLERIIIIIIMSSKW